MEIGREFANLIAGQPSSAGDDRGDGGSGNAGVAFNLGLGDGLGFDQVCEHLAVANPLAREFRLFVVLQQVQEDRKIARLATRQFAAAGLLLQQIIGYRQGGGADRQFQSATAATDESSPGSCSARPPNRRQRFHP